MSDPGVDQSHSFYIHLSSLSVMRIIFFIVLLICSFPSWSHQFLPTEARLTLISQEEYVLGVELDVIELMQRSLLIDGIPEELIDKVRALTQEELEQALQLAKADILNSTVINIDGDEQKLEKFVLHPASYVKRLLAQHPGSTEYRITGIARGRLPQNTENIRFQFPREWGTVNMTVVRSASTLVAPGTESMPIYLSTSTQTSTLDQVANYLYQGVLHIIPKGLDHILFVLALFLLSTRFKNLLWQVTVFTLAHTITLILAGYKLVNVPASVVEPLIALSIAWVALENIYHNKLKAWRIGIIFLFGLLHGLGFASVLLDLGLPNEWAFLSLVSFNIGVEIGQVIVVSAAFLAVGWFKQRTWYRQRVVLPASAIIAATGLFWSVERILA